MPNPMKDALGKRHREVREQILRMSVADYAAAMHVKDVTVYSWESGRTTVPRTILDTLERRHGVSAGWMLTGRGPMIVAEGATPLEQLESHITAITSLVADLRNTAPDVLAPAPRKRGSRRGTRIPMLSLGVSAGPTVEAADTVEREIDLADMLVEHPDSTYFIRVVGDSMSGAGIADGDTLIVDCAVTARPGQIVIARVYGELTMKRYTVVDGQPVLRAENTRHKDIAVTPDMDFTIVGVVKSCIKQF